MIKTTNGAFLVLSLQLLFANPSWGMTKSECRRALQDLPRLSENEVYQCCGNSEIRNDCIVTLIRIGVASTKATDNCSDNEYKNECIIDKISKGITPAKANNDCKRN